MVKQKQKKEKKWNVNIMIGAILMIKMSMYYFISPLKRLVFRKKRLIGKRWEWNMGHKSIDGLGFPFSFSPSKQILYLSFIVEIDSTFESHFFLCPFPFIFDSPSIT